MFVFKLSWLPYMFIIAGIALAAEGQPAALILCVIGGVWLYFKFKNKKAENTSRNPNNPNTSNNANASSAPYATNNVPHAVHIVSESASSAGSNKTTAKFCSKCGTKVNPGSSFCSNCGSKL